MASRPVRLCLRCAEAESDSELLASNDLNRLVVEESLRQIYEWLRDRLDERRSEELGRGLHDAAQG